MKTIQDFYDKYGTGKNYEDFFSIMLHAKFSTDLYLHTKYVEFIDDLELLFQSDFDCYLWRDYNYLRNYSLN